MAIAPDGSSRREFVADVGRLASAVALTACTSVPSVRGQPEPTASTPTSGAWDMSWIDRLATATDRAIAMPSGIFGLARAQNAGCALVRL